MVRRTMELTEQTRQAVDDYLQAAGKVPGEFLFTSRRRPSEAMTTRQYARLVAQWIAGIGLDPHVFGTHSLRRTKATLISPHGQPARGPAFARPHEDRKYGPLSRYRG
jgi:integrase